MTETSPYNKSNSETTVAAFNSKREQSSNKAPFLFKKKDKQGLEFRRLYTKAGLHPYDEIKWEIRDATITSDKRQLVFSQKEVEIPSVWSQTATNIAVSHYFRGRIGTKERERSARQMVDRVAKTISNWGRTQGYFKDEESAEIYEQELTYILINQHAAFNSPVWYNVGVEERPQCSACFINSVQDDMRSILNLAVTEGMLFKFGSGTGTNLSILRSSKEYLSNSNGKASGPVSFMKGFDAFAGVIKSGGKTRRAAKMVILNVDHPDIEEFIECKAREEKKAWALIEKGYSGSFGGEAYGSVFFQNSNNSVRVTKAFMDAVVKDKPWHTRAGKTGKIMDTYRARDLMRKIAEAAHVCGDPGLQFDTTINEWHTCKATSRINASNPCSEYMFIDNSSCNLSSLNLLKFLDESGGFKIKDFCHVVNIMLIAQDIIVDNGSYPTEKIRENSVEYRPLGLGYANLGALLMCRGYPYDSDEGRAYAAAVSALLTGQAYKTSAHISKAMGPFKHFDANRESMHQVIQMHRYHLTRIESSYLPDELLSAVNRVWNEASSLGFESGYRNAQVTVG